MSYDMIDRFLRNNLSDDDYAEYSSALDSLCTPQQRKPLTDRQINAIWDSLIASPDYSREMIVRAIEAAHGIKGDT